MIERLPYLAVAGIAGLVLVAYCSLLVHAVCGLFSARYRSRYPVSDAESTIAFLPVVFGLVVGIGWCLDKVLALS